MLKQNLQKLLNNINSSSDQMNKVKQDIRVVLGKNAMVGPDPLARIDEDVPGPDMLTLGKTCAYTCGTKCSSACTRFACY